MWIIRPQRRDLARRTAGLRRGPVPCPARRRPGLGADRAGVTSLEYALMGAFIMGTIVAAVSGFTGGLGSLMASSFAAVAASM